MNPFQRARNEARSVRAKLAPGKESEPIEAKVLLASVETVIKLAIAHVDANYPDLGGGSAVLQRLQKFIYVSKEFEEWGDRFCGLVAHELGHWYLDAAKAPTTIAHLKTLLGSEGSPASMKVEAYGVRERQELQANVFARELLIPRELARKLAAKGLGPAKIADNLGIPLEFARQQMLDALLLPAAEESITPLKEPSPDQIKAAQATERFANVVAGPGTGKTTTLIHRIKYLIEEKKVDPSHILVLTFTNKAALELVERLRGAGIERAADVWAGTFHAFGLEFLRKFHQRFGLEADLNVADKLTAITALVADLPQLDLKYYLRVEDPYDWLGPVVNGITRLKEELVSPKAYRSLVERHKSNDDELQRRREDVATLYEAHEALLAKRKTVDFVDLIAKPALAIRDDRAPYSELADKFQHILVDEYQDVTEAMVELLRQLAPKAKSLWVVGDIRQAIHHWRGASLKSLMKFSSVFEAQAGGKKIGRYSLDQNRRSHKEILDLVNEVGRRHRLEALLPLDKMESTKGACGEKPTVVNCAKRADVIGAVIAEVIALKNAGVPYGKQTVLCRNSNDVHRSAEALATAGIPIVHIGELAQRPEVKLLLCMMQLLVERQPRALIGLMSIPSLRMPMADIQTLFQASDTDVAYQRARWLTNPPPGLSAAGAKVLTALRKLLGANRHYSNPWSFVCDLILEHRFALPDEKDTSVEAWVQRIALWQFAYAVRNGEGDMKEARLSRFLLRQRLRQRLGETYVDRELPSETSALDGVRVQTVHSSKGLEFDAVHVAYVSADSYGQARRIGIPVSVLRSLRQRGYFEVQHKTSRVVSFHEADLAAFEAKIAAFHRGLPASTNTESLTLERVWNLKFKFQDGKGLLAAAVLDGTIPSSRSDIPGIGGILIDKAQVESFIAQCRSQAYGDTITPTEVRKLLHCDPVVVPDMVSTGHLDGCWYEAGLRVTRASVVRFGSEFRSLASLAKELQTTTRRLKRRSAALKVSLLEFQRPNGIGPQPFVSVSDYTKLEVNRE